MVQVTILGALSGEVRLELLPWRIVLLGWKLVGIRSRRGRLPTFVSQRGSIRYARPLGILSGEDRVLLADSGLHTDEVP